MSFFVDEMMTAHYGEPRYSGGKDGSPANWPGMGGRPPLEIPADHFCIRWVTDGSVRMRERLRMCVRVPHGSCSMGTERGHRTGRGRPLPFRAASHSTVARHAKGMYLLVRAKNGSRLRCDTVR